MKTVSLSGINRSMHIPSMSQVLSRNPDLVRRLNTMTGNRVSMLRTASRRSSMKQSMPWLIGAGAVALVGAGIGIASKILGNRGMTSSSNGDNLASQNSGYTLQEKYPAGFASAGSIPSPGSVSQG